MQHHHVPYNTKPAHRNKPHYTCNHSQQTKLLLLCHKNTTLRIVFSTTEMSPPTEGPLPTDTPFNICDNILCEFGRCVEVDGNATCECNNACPLIYDPVCGTNNKTYPNLCVMDSEACKEKELVQTQYSGECSKFVSPSR